MTMTAEEIVRDYKQAKYPEKQIRILADMNGCGPSNIKEILKAAGCELPRAGRPKKEAPAPAPAEGAWSEFDPKTKELVPAEPPIPSILPAPAGAGDFQEEAPEAEAAAVLPEPKDDSDDTVPVSEALPLILRTSAVDVIARLLKDTRNNPESGAKFTEQVRGVLALVHEVETRSKEI